MTSATILPVYHVYGVHSYAGLIWPGLRGVQMVHRGQIAQFVKMPYPTNYVELEREATTVLILEERRIEFRQIDFSTPFPKIKSFVARAGPSFIFQQDQEQKTKKPHIRHFLRHRVLPGKNVRFGLKFDQRCRLPSLLRPEEKRRKCPNIICSFVQSVNISPMFCA